jgi:hypothetical protein
MFVAALLPTGPPNNSPTREEPVLVFKYRPGLFAPNMEARLRDDDRILRMLHDLKIGHICDGSMGRGYEVKIWKKDVERWKSGIDRLMNDGVLQFYRWGTDMKGYGLIPLK